ncbi:MAG: hypothetical protein H6747_00100 [Deltaproteobacteria bacterium]|nr:hypothetical protein [Deltaproteobacteria bacterium]
MSRTLFTRAALGPLVTTLVLLVATLGCGRSPAPSQPAAQPAAAAVAAAAAQPAPAPAAATATAEAAGAKTAAAEAAAYSQRRVRKRAVIGGCEESCETPTALLRTLIAGLQLQAGEQRRNALHGLFEWSQLIEDGEERGEHWSDLWGEPTQHATRMREIEAFLDRFARVADGDRGAATLARWQGDGLTIRPVANRSDLQSVAVRMPDGSDGEALWRFTLVRRGWEWLVGEVERQPSRRPAPLDRLAGSTERGHL